MQDQLYFICFTITPLFTFINEIILYRLSQSGNKTRNEQYNIVKNDLMWHNYGGSNLIFFHRVCIYIII